MAWNLREFLREEQGLMPVIRLHSLVSTAPHGQLRLKQRLKFLTMLGRGQHPQPFAE